MFEFIFFPILSASNLQFYYNLRMTHLPFCCKMNHARYIIMYGDPKDIIDEIIQTITTSESPEQTLDTIVSMVADRFCVDVCSVYIYNPYGNTLILKATVGLNKNLVGIIEMDVSEGLTGLVIESMAPVFIVKPANHPRFKFYAGSGEEIYRTYLGLPLIYHQKVLGALVVQTQAEDGISESHVPIFKNIAGQIAAIVAYTQLQEKGPKKVFPVLEKKESPSPVGKGVPFKPNTLKGVAVSDRAATGYAHYLFENIGFDQVHCLYADEPSQEIDRLDEAFRKAEAQIKKIGVEARGVSDQEKAIIETHLMVLADPSLREKIVGRINDRLCAEYALKQVILESVETFKDINDPYLSERAGDIMDIGRRVLGYLVGVGGDVTHAFTRDTIIISSDLSPVDLLNIRQPNLKGIVLAKGGKTSHTVIIAKSMEIPIVIGVDGILDTVSQGDFLIIDGVSGFVHINPTEEIQQEYARREAENRSALKQLENLRDLPAVTLDGFNVHIGANIGLLSDIMLAGKYGAEVIGLYRTEFPFLLRKSFPTEKEQVSLYRRVLEKAGDRPVTIRTFDVGGDKFLSYLDSPKEDNPFLGWRSIRLSLDLEEVFRIQIRAILRASTAGRVKILFPMITGVEEIRQVVKLVEDEKRSLEAQGIAYSREIPLGVMVEVPAAVAILDRLVRYADFISIGTNDLIQYVLAVDRNNKKVAARYNALHPAVITTIHQIITLCRQVEKPVNICGEAAAVPACILMFVGMGATDISMTPSSIPAAKQFIRSIHASFCRELLASVMKMEDANEVTQFLNNKISNLKIKGAVIRESENHSSIST